MPATNPEQSIFLAALELPTPAERAAYLKGACGVDAALLANVQELLAAHLNADDFLDRPPPNATIDEQPVTERPGTVIGPYKLKEQIGEGGMGLVFVAEQQEPVRRKVALKIIKPGMDSREVIARFEAERQALALMDHPNIARIFGAGTTGTGRPYFVMELVKGIPIIEYCDAQQFSTRDRLDLFVSVCQAVQHAHGKGIIHRDLKPSNILVAPHDGVPVVKVIDFGVAKAIGQQLTDKTIYTRFTQMIGTPLYMSPEQAEVNALDVDTRSDVYSLGVLLYELLTGTTPFDKKRFAQVAYDEIRRIIKEEEPPKPSVRLSTMGEPLSKVSQQRKSELTKLSALVNGDLDWIVMKALEKDRGRRYDTASAFAADVRRFLAQEPIEARPPSAWYRFGKLARRNKAALTTVALVAAVLVASTALSSWQALRARQAEVEERRQRELASAAAIDATEQRELALENNKRASEKEQLARDNERTAKKERDDARSARDQTRRLLYDADMDRAYRSWQDVDDLRVSRLLARHQTGEPDLRDFEWHFLNRLTHSQVMELHSFWGAELLYSADGKRLVAYSTRDPRNGGPGKVQIWDSPTGKELRRFQLNEGEAARFTADGMGLVIDRRQPGAKPGENAVRELRVLDLETETERCRLVPENESGPLHAVSSNGSLVLLGKDVYETVGGKKRARLDAADEPVRLAVISPDGTTITTVSGQLPGDASQRKPQPAKVWDASTGKELKTLKDEEVIYELAYHPDGRHVATMGGHITLWDTATGKPTQQFRHWMGATRIGAFSPDGRWLATANSYDLELWDVSTGHIFNTFHMHNHISGIAFSPDGRRLACVPAFFSDTLKVWDVTARLAAGEPRELNRFAPELGLAFSPDGKQIAATSGNPKPGKTKPGWVALRDAFTLRQEWHVKLDVNQGAFDVAFHPDGSRLAVAVTTNPHVHQREGPGKVIVLQAATGKKLLEFEAGSAVYSVVFSPDGKMLATPYGNHVRFWDVDTGKMLSEFNGHTTRVAAIAFSPDGTKVVSGGEEVIVWETKTGKELVRFRVSLGFHNRRMAFGPDGKRIATLSGVRDAATGAVLFEFERNYVENVAFSPDGRRLVISGHDLMLFDISTGQAVATLNQKMESTVHNAIFSPDGQRLAAVNIDGTLQIYDAALLPSGEASKVQASR